MNFLDWRKHVFGLPPVALTHAPTLTTIQKTDYRQCSPRVVDNT
uniref:Uncharacterized protein n=1 Tax=Podoviridae sp. ctlpi2 TaxID=2826574 RepID=A0A8S5MM80_9CAUD|nr:MAG TPA: hypothetical protein [Podoviridae sp. ctlpi2]